MRQVKRPSCLTLTNRPDEMDTTDSNKNERKDTSWMRPGKIVQIKNQAGGEDFYWYIHAFCSGPEGVESVVVVSNADSRQPVKAFGDDGYETREVKHVPLPMLKALVESGSANVLDEFASYDHAISV